MVLTSQRFDRTRRLALTLAGIPEHDAFRLGQTLNNFVNNETKFSERGEIRLNIDLVEGTGDKVQLKFAVQDTGIGMTARSQGDIPLAERFAHTVTGVAGNIGTQAVQAAAGAWEKFIRGRANSKEVETALGQVAATLEPLLHGLPARLTPRGATSASKTGEVNIDPEKSRDAAAQLARLLSEFDPAAAEFVESNRATRRGLVTADAWPDFEKLVQDYSFANAQARLEEVLKRLTPT